MNLAYRSRMLTVGAVVAAILVCGTSSVHGQGAKAEKLTLKDGKAKVDSELTDKDPNDTVRKHPCKHFTLDMKKGETYQIDMVSKKIDSYLRLEDSDNKELAHDDDGGGFPDARIVFQCSKDGNYRIIGTTFDGGTGPFTLTVVQKGAAKVAGGELKFKDGAASVDAKLDNTDNKDTVRKQSLCKIYTVKLAKGKTYQIDMVSKAIDSYLRLEDAKGTELAQDDDGGGFPDARIVFECKEDGVYRIIATTFAPAEGEFTLSVKEK